MSDFTRLLARNRNYRWTWMGQIVSEVGDHFNNVAVLSLTMDETHNGAAIAALMLSRAIPAIIVGPFAGVLLDRFDRRRIMIASDLVRGVLALGFILAIKFDTSNGKLLARISVGKGPHGLCVYPQPGRYSLGHTGNMR